MKDPAGDLERAPQQMGSEGKVCGSQRIAHFGTADADAIDLDGLRGLYGKTFFGADLLQEIKITDSVATKAEVVADLKMPHAQPVNQHGVYELGSTELAEALIEGKTQHQINTLPGEQIEFVTQAGQTCRRRIRGEKLARLRFEDDHTAGQAQLDGALAQACQDSLMAPVNTVEVANGGDAAPVLRAQIVKASNQLHNALLAHKVADYNHTPSPTTGDTSGQTTTIDVNRQKTTTDPTGSPCGQSA
jgi:hypothetical protein